MNDNCNRELNKLNDYEMFHFLWRRPLQIAFDGREIAF